MPYTVSKTKSGKFQVRSPHGVKARGTSKAKAMAQANLLRGVEHGWKPTAKPARRSRVRRNPITMQVEKPRRKRGR